MLPKRYTLQTKNGNGGAIDKKQFVLKSKFAYYLRLGLSLEESRKLVGCSTPALNNLRCDLTFEEFIQACVAENKVIHLKNIDTAGKSGAWQASAWFLERRYPEEFGKKDIVKHEYQIKLQTLQSVLVKIINEEIPDAHLRYKIVNRIRNYEFDGSEAMDNSFKQKQIGYDEVIDLED